VLILHKDSKRHFQKARQASGCTVKVELYISPENNPRQDRPKTALVRIDRSQPLAGLTEASHSQERPEPTICPETDRSQPLLGTPENNPRQHRPKATLVRTDRKQP
jgi:hypothetical protein